MQVLGWYLKSTRNTSSSSSSSITDSCLRLLLFLLFLALRLLLLGLSRLRVRVALPLQLARRHILPHHLVRHLLSSLLELADVLLQQCDGHLLQLARKQLAFAVVLGDLFEFGVILFKVGQICLVSIIILLVNWERRTLEGDVDVWVSAEFAVFFDCISSSAEGVFVDFVLLVLVLVSFTE